MTASSTIVNKQSSEHEALQYTDNDNYDLRLSKQKICLDKIIDDLPEYIEHDELELYYQPQIDVSTGKTRSVEALVRWSHRYAGNIPPYIFIPLAERTGHINKLTDWVLDKALWQMSEWNNSGVTLDVAVNLSVHNFNDSSFPQKVSDLLDKWSVPASQLILEITEGVMIKDTDRVIYLLSLLRESGVRLSLDDFGSGYSSLSYLSNLPINELKIDRTLVMDIDRNSKNSTIVQSIIKLAKSLGLSVVAEGVESLNAYSKLAKFKCDTAQGFYFSKPICCAEFSSWLYHSDWGIGLDTYFANSLCPQIA